MILKICYNRRRRISVFILVVMACQIALPILPHSSEAKATSDDFSGFTPIQDGNYVDLFSGNFNYGIPVLNLPNGPYEPFGMQLSYSSSNTMDSESSWVGDGWSLSPGSIDRNVRGYPDEFNGANIIKIEKRLPSWTVEGEFKFGVDFFSKKQLDDKEKELKKDRGDTVKNPKINAKLSIDASTKVRYSNQSGYVKSYSLGLGTGYGGISLNFSPAGTTYAFQPDIMKIAGKLSDMSFENKNWYKNVTSKSQKFVKKYYLNRINASSSVNAAIFSSDRSFSFAGARKTTVSPRYFQNNIAISLGGAFIGVPYVNIGLRGGVDGNFGLSWDGNLNESKTTTYKVYGYNHTKEVGIKNVINDYMTERGSEFSQQDLFLGIPYNNYDQYSVSAQGIGGSFHYHKEKGGYYMPDEVKNLGINSSTGFDVNAGLGGVGLGLDIGLAGSVNKVSGDSRNIPEALVSDASGQAGWYRFNNDPGGKVQHTTEPVVTPYCRLKTNPLSVLPGLKIVNPSYAHNGIQPVKESTNLQAPGNVALPRGAGIKRIKQLDDNKGFEITSSDGKKYVFDIPVYHRNDVQISVSCGESQGSNGGLVRMNLPLSRQAGQNGQYAFDVNSFQQVSGEMNLNKWPATFLLSKITGPDYHEIGTKKYGYFVKFTYRAKYKFGAIDSYFLDRAPKQGLSYQHGKVANKRDQMANVNLVEKEVYYLEKIETNTHEAYFVTNKSRLLGSGNGDTVYRYTVDSKYLSSIQSSIDSSIFNHLNLQFDTSAFLGTNFLSVHDSYRYWMGVLGWPQAMLYVDSSNVLKFNLQGRFPTSKNYKNIYLIGSQKNRLDNLSAPVISSTADLSANGLSNGQLTNCNALEYLEKIVVFSKSKNSSNPNIRPDQVVYLSYDYSNWPGQFNSLATNGAKLTLKNVWSESEDFVKSKIAPYEFSYQYKKNSDYSASARAQYAPYLPGTNLNQTPLWRPDLADGWGQIGAFTQFLSSQYADIQYQGSDLKSKNYYAALINSSYLKPDPASYKLKQIRLPGGGEILVDYEENEYQYVQNRRAMSMVSLVDKQNEIAGSGYARNPSYWVDIRDLGLVPTTDTNSVEYRELRYQRSLINTYFEDKPGLGKEMLFYKYLYRLHDHGSENRDINPTAKQVDWVEGYTSFGQARIALKPGYGYTIVIDIQAVGGVKPNVPRQACYDYYTNTRYKMESGPEHIGKVEEDQNTSSYKTWLKDLTSTNLGDQLKARWTAVIPLMGKMVGNNFPGFVNIPDPDDVGDAQNLDLSWLRLPMLKPKKGGGVRVKRLLFYDAGMEGESGTAMLYGKEYNYSSTEILPGTQATSIISSGVASNEPAALKHENPFTAFMPKNKQGWLQKVITGENRDQAEGPIGETVMPPPSIGYSRVITQDINKQVHGTGFTSNEFLTYKDYPVYHLYTNLDTDTSEFKTEERGLMTTNLDEQKEKDKISLSAGQSFGPLSLGFSYSLQKYWASQGFRFIQHDLNGKPKRSASYAGVYDRDTWKIGRIVSNPKLPGELESEEVTYYTKPGELLPVVKDVGTGTVEYDIPGKETDIAFETRQIEDNNLNVGVSFDLNFWVLPVNPTASASLSLAISESNLYTYAGSNVIRYPSYVKAIERESEGIRTRQDFLVFDYNSGQPIATKTVDHFDKAIYQITIPAYWKQENASFRPWYMQSASDRDVKTQELGHVAESFAFYDFDPMVRSTGGRHLIKNILKPATEWQNLLNQTATVYGQPSNAPAFNTVLINRENLAPSVSDPLKQNRPLQICNFVYKASTFQSRIPGEASLGGLVKGPYSTFNFADVPSNYTGNKWIMVDSTTGWHPGGFPLEKANALKNYSSTEVSSVFFTVKASSNLARYGQNYFEDFENDPSLSPSDSMAHTGLKAKFMNFNTSGWNSLDLHPILSQAGSKYFSRFWLKRLDNLNDKRIQMRFPGSSPAEATLISTCESWGLYEVNFPVVPAGLQTLEVYADAGVAFYLDDIKIQRIESEMNCQVVSTENLKPIAKFDDNHFPLLYQYDGTGRLIRTIKETERGRFTLQEQILKQPESSRF